MAQINLPKGEIGYQGFVIPYGDLRAAVGDDAKLKKLLNSMTVKEKVHPGRVKGMSGTIRKAYKLVGNSLIVPRRMAGLLHRIVAHSYDPIIAASVPRKIPESSTATDEELYPYQKSATDHILKVLSAKENFGVAYLQMDTGLGKTRVGCAIIVGRAEPAAVIVPTEAIAEQWVEEFKEMYPSMKVAIYHNLPKNSRKVQVSPETHDVIIIIINTFREKTPEFMIGFGTTILDEVHELHSKCNSNALWLAQTRAVVGLSATPDERPDGLDKFIFHFLGAPIYPANIPGFDVSSVNFKCNVRAIEYCGHPNYCETVSTPAGTMSAILTISNILEDPFRMNLIAAEIGRLCNMINISTIDPANKRHGVFVFAETREFLPKLKSALLRDEAARNAVIMMPEIEDIDVAAFDDADAAISPPLKGEFTVITPSADPISILRGGAAKNAVSDAKRAGAHIVLTTYGFSRRGISLPDMTCIIAATPRRNGLRQIIGRILRRGSDETIAREFIDIIDINTGLRGQFADRRKVYNERKYPINKFRTIWSDYGVEAVAPPPAANASAQHIAGCMLNGASSAIFERDVAAGGADVDGATNDEYEKLSPEEVMDLLYGM